LSDVSDTPKGSLYTLSPLLILLLHYTASHEIDNNTDHHGPVSISTGIIAQLKRMMTLIPF
jgi:hypothetical protein